MTAALDCEEVPSPLGPILVLATATHVVGLDFLDAEARLRQLVGRRFGPGFSMRPKRGVLGVASSLEAYFAGALDALDAVPVDAGGTPFQSAVWAHLRQIPPGRTITYAALAAAVGRPGAARAAGRANATNPISLVIPCHRIVGSDAALTGYSGGLARKAWLIEHERAGTGDAGALGPKP